MASLQPLALALVAFFGISLCQGCTWTGFNECAGDLNNVQGQVDKDKLCPVMIEGKECFGRLWEGCKDGAILSAINTTLSAMQEGLVYCADYSDLRMKTTYYPTRGWDKSSTDRSTESWDKRSTDRSTDSWDKRSTDRSTDSWDKRSTDRSTDNWDRDSHHTTSYPILGGCSKENMNNCVRPIKMYDGQLAGQCAYVGDSMNCLYDLHSHCESTDMREYFEMVEKKINECKMYGHPYHEGDNSHGDGDNSHGDGGYYGSAGTVSYSSPLFACIAALATTAAASLKWF